MASTDVAWVVAGAAVVVVVLGDLGATLMVTGGIWRRWRPSGLFYRSTWWLWTTLASRASSEARRDRILGLFAPFSLVGLLTMWIVGVMLGWSLVWYGVRDQLAGDQGFGSIVYFSGVVLLTVGFGDIVATGGVARVLTLMEAALGLATVALVISYLPSLYNAYGRRESKLLMLDQPSGERIMPVSLVEVHGVEGSTEELYRWFEGWEVWAAEVLESHTSYPMLAYFRSHHRGQSWITALGVVVDAAVLTASIVPGAEVRQPFFVYRRGRRAIVEIAARLTPDADDESWLDRELFRVAYDRVVATGLPARDFDDAWERLSTFRQSYGGQLQALINYLAAPPGFWGHGSEDELVEPPLS